MQLQVKASMLEGCTFLGKGILNHPEMGVIEECRKVIFDEWDTGFQHWKGTHEITKIMYRTDTGFAFSHELIEDGIYVIELYAPNWRAKKPNMWCEGIDRG